jgi:quercetin dioxygenase-like cupin family protein
VTEKIRNSRGPSSRISRRTVMRMAPVFPIALAAGGFATDLAIAQGGYEQGGPKATQILRRDLLEQANQVQESVVTLVEFSPGQAAPWHMHPGAQEILYLVEGNLTVEVEGQGPKAITAGDIVLTPAEVPHSVGNAGTTVTAKAVVMHSRADKEKPLLVNVRK